MLVEDIRLLLLVSGVGGSVLLLVEDIRLLLLLVSGVGGSASSLLEVDGNRLSFRRGRWDYLVAGRGYLPPPFRRGRW